MNKIAPGLAHLAVPIVEISPDPINANTHGKRSIASLKYSLDRFGQRKPIVVQKDGMVIRAGHGVVTAASELGWDEVAALVVDEADVEATGFALVDNRSAQLSEWNLEMLSESFKIVEGTFDFGELGWDNFEVGFITDLDFVTPKADPTQKGRDFGVHRLVFSPDQWEALAKALGGSPTAELVIKAVLS
uniref:ParB-like N-terminal domain-containing protein n=1 Tax=viral metagenome TaxID=1070528 RepID=A0A6M3KSM4_9ZZZZ